MDKKRFHFINWVPIQNQIVLVVEIGLSPNARKSHLKQITGINALEFAKNTGYTSYKLNGDKLGIVNLETVLTDLSELINVVDNDVKKCMMNLLQNLILLIQANRILENRLKILKKRYVIPVHLLRPKALID